MSLRDTVERMPGEKQVAWGVRLFMTLTILAMGTISWNALDKLDRISQTQAAQTAVLNRLVADDSRRVNRMDDLQERYYALADRVRAMELRFDQMERIGVTPERQ